MGQLRWVREKGQSISDLHFDISRSNVFSRKKSIEKPTLGRDVRSCSYAASTAASVPMACSPSRTTATQHSTFFDTDFFFLKISDDCLLARKPDIHIENNPNPPNKVPSLKGTVLATNECTSPLFRGKKYGKQKKTKDTYEIYI